MGPVATGLGRDLPLHRDQREPHRSQELTTLHDWVDQAAAAVGTRSGGGQHLGRQSASSTRCWSNPTPREVRTHPRRRVRALSTNNLNVGGGYVVQAGELHLVQGVALTTRHRSEIGNIVDRRPRRRSDPDPRSRRGASRATRSGAARHRRRRGRGRTRAGLHAHGREQPRGDRAPPRAHGRDRREPSRGRRARRRSTNAPNWSTRSSKPSRRTCSRARSWSSPYSSSSSATSEPV